MRSVGYVVYDPHAPVGSPVSRSRREEEVVQFCQREGHTLSAVFADPFGVGAEGRSALPQMFRHLRDQADQFLVVVIDPAHLGATPEGAVEAVLNVDHLGSRVVSTEADHPDPLQALLHVLHNTGPEGERRKRIRKAMQSKALLGKGLGRTPYGYRIGEDGKLEAVPEEAEMVRLMFRLYLEEDKGMRRIAQYLNQSGYHTRRGRPWTMTTLRDILRNRVYIGTYHRFGLRLPRNHSPIIEPTHFRRVQDKMQSRSPRRRDADAQPFVLSGLAYCIQCGNRVIGVTHRQTWRRKDGQRMQGIYRYYQCQSRANQSLCQYHTWRAQDLEEAVVEQVRQQVDRGLPVPVGEQLPKRRTPEGEDEAERRRKSRYMKYLRQAADGTISLRRLRFLLGRLATTSPVDRPDSSPGSVAPGIEAPPDPQAILVEASWERLDDATRHRILQQWVERVDVADKELRVSVRSA